MKVFPLTSSLLPYPLSNYWANCAQQCSKSNWNSGEANQPNDDLTGKSSTFKNTLRLQRISKQATTVFGRRRAISMNFSNRLTKPRRANNQMPWANNKMPWTTSSQQPDALALMMMIAFITFKSSLVPLFEGLWSSNSWESELSGFSRNRTDDLGIDSPSLWPTEPRLHVRSLLRPTNSVVSQYSGL